VVPEQLRIYSSGNTLRTRSEHLDCSGLIPSEFVLSSTLTPPTTPEEEEGEELGQKRSRSDSDSDAQGSLPPPLPASSWLLPQKSWPNTHLTLAPSYVRKRLTREPLASLPQWSSREPQVLRVVARLSRLDPFRPRGMPKVANLLPLRTAQALEEVGGDHKPEAQHLL
jgi:hypothetical protein